jgi:hypothetical protein
MLKMFATLSLAICTCAFPMLGQAQQQSPVDRLDARFQAADTDHNGQLSREEAEKGMPALARHFDQIAGDKGFVTLEDLHAAMAEMAKKRQGG